MADQPGIVTALVLLPKFYNPDEAGNRAEVEWEKFEQTANEIAAKFEEGGTIHWSTTNPAVGLWWDKGVVERDVLVILEHDFEDTPENREWLRVYAKDVLLKRFCQKAIYLKYLRLDRDLIQGDDEII